jgi:predicted nucleic acid-binding protein
MPSLKALLDTNVLLDLFAPDRPQHAAADQMMSVLVEHGVAMCFAATSLKDVYYLAVKSQGEPAARHIVSVMLDELECVPVDRDVCRAAVLGNEPDVEDGIVAACAQRAGAGFIVTRDAAGFKRASVAKATPSELVEAVESWHQAQGNL